MNSHPSHPADFERAILRALCAAAINPDVWQEIRPLLADYAWRNPDHAVIYEAIVRVKAHGGSITLSHIAAQTTRMGFPDLDLDGYFPSIGESGSNVIQLVHQLRAAAARDT